jgi:hypothetical protein
MVAKPFSVDLSALPSREFSPLLDASFKLAFASWKPVFWLGFWFNLAMQLPFVWWWWNTRGLFAADGWRAWLDPDVFEWDAGLTWSSVVALVASVACMNAILVRMGALMRRGDIDSSGSIAKAIRTLPGGLALVLLYLGLLVACLLPVIVAWFVVPVGDDPDWQLPRLLAVLVALILVAVPLTWMSIAAAFALPAFLLDDEPVLAAQRRSFARVRGNWTRSAALVTVPMLAWMGLVSVVGSAPLGLAASAVLALDGWGALVRPGWLVLGQLLSTPVLALLTPLCFAGWLVCYEDLRLRQRVAEG